MPASDPQGKVALLLCESLLHVLVEERVIGREAALSAIDSALELTRESDDPKTGTAERHAAAALIERIAASFAVKD